MSRDLWEAVSPTGEFAMLILPNLVAFYMQANRDEIYSTCILIMYVVYTLHAGPIGRAV